MISRWSNGRRRSAPRRAMAALAAALLGGAASAPIAAAMPSPSTAVTAELPVLAPLSPAAIPSGTFAVLRGDDGTPVYTVTSAQFDRFYGAALAQSQQRSLRRTVPLVPPNFTACVRAMKAGTLDEDPGTSALALARQRSQPGRREQCAAQYDEIRDTAGRQVLNLYWILVEMQRRRMAFTELRIAHELASIQREQFQGVAGFRVFLRRSGLAPADVRLNVIAQLGQTAIVRQLQAAVPATGTRVARMEAQQRAIDAFRAVFLQASFARTACAPAYVELPACSAPRD